MTGLKILAPPTSWKKVKENRKKGRGKGYFYITQLCPINIYVLFTGVSLDTKVYIIEETSLHVIGCLHLGVKMASPKKTAVIYQMRLSKRNRLWLE